MASFNVHANARSLFFRHTNMVNLALHRRCRRLDLKERNSGLHRNDAIDLPPAALKIRQ